MDSREMEIQDLEQDLVAPDLEVPARSSAELFEQMEGEEMPDMRTENTKQFDLGENRYQTVIFSEPVHYQEAGEWREIDNNLEAVDKGNRKVLRNRANTLLCELASQADQGDLVTLRSKGCVLNWSFEQQAAPAMARIVSGEMLRREDLMHLAKQQPGNARRMDGGYTEEELSALQTPEERRSDLTAKSSQVLYDDILPGINVRYTLSGKELKEDIIVTEREALDQVRLRLPSTYEYRVNEDGSLSVCDEAGMEQFYFDVPVIYDACGMSVIGKPVIERQPDYTRLSYQIDEEFLGVAAFPITIDPVARERSNSTKVTAKYIDTLNCTTNVHV